MLCGNVDTSHALYYIIIAHSSAHWHRLDNISRGITKKEVKLGNGSPPMITESIKPVASKTATIPFVDPIFKR